MTRGRKRELLKSFKIDSVPQWFDDDESVHRYDDLYSIYILYIYMEEQLGTDDQEMVHTLISNQQV